MAKIYLKFGRDALVVNEDVAQELRQQFEDVKKSGKDLSLVAKTVDHSGGSFLLTFNQIDAFDTEKNPYKKKHTFSDEDGIKRFHEKYGSIKPSIVQGYGLVDRDTQFLIDAGFMILEDMGAYKVLRSNPNKSQENREHLFDLWKEYNDEHKQKFKD